MRLALILVLAPATALAQPAAVGRAPGLDAWLDAVADAETAIDEDCAALAAAGGPPAGRVWLRAGPDGVAVVAADEGSAAAAAWWAEATLGAREAAAALFGGRAAALDGLMIEADEAGLRLFDGLRLRDSDLCGALGAVAAAAGGEAPGDNPFAAARAAAAATVMAPIGGEATVTLRDLPPGGETAIRGPDGVAVEIGPVAADGSAEARVAPQPGAEPGPGELRVYDPSDPFRPVAALPLRVLPGGGAAAMSAAVLTPGGAAAGRLAVGAEAVVSVEVAEGARLTFRSTGPEDLRARLETADGALIAENDDAPGGYGFALSAQLAPGAYRLRVAHCCGGGGAFAVEATADQ